MTVIHLKFPAICPRRRSTWKLPMAFVRWRAKYLNADRSVKIVVFLLASIFMFFFVIPHVYEFFRLRNQHLYKTKNLDACIAEKLQPYELAISRFDAVTVHDALPFHRDTAAASAQGEERGQERARAERAGTNQADANDDSSVESHYLAFVGNGQIGVHLRFPGNPRAGDLLVRTDRTITLSTSYNPLFRLELPGYVRESGLLVALRDGLLHEFSCFRKNDVCVSTERIAYAHRVYPSLIVQEIRVGNPTVNPVTFRLFVAAPPRAEPLSAAALAKLSASLSSSSSAPNGQRTVFIRDSELHLGAADSDRVLPTRLFVEAVVRSSSDAATAKLQLIGAMTISYAAKGFSTREYELSVGARSSRSHVECSFVRTRTIAIEDANQRALDTEVSFLESELKEDLLSLAPRYCRFQLAIAARLRTSAAEPRPGSLAPISLAQAIDDDTATEFITAYGPLRALHTAGWNALYANGSSFEISYSRAPRALNPTRINATLFYLLGHVPLIGPNVLQQLSNGTSRQQLPELLASLALDEEQVLERLKQFAAPHAVGAPRTLDACYESRVSTFAAGSSGQLWQPVFDVSSLAAVADAWLVTLNKKRCAPLVRSGAFGLLEAAILSFGPFRFVHSHSGGANEPRGSESEWDDAVHRHLELVADPNDLHRDRMHFARLRFNEEVSLSILMELQVGSNKPFLFVEAERTVGVDEKDDREADEDGEDHEHLAARRAARWPALTLLATDAELKSIVEMQIAAGHRRSASVRFAIKYTDPPTALLYVAESRAHLEELRVATPVRGVLEFNAHPADIISLHREGHAFGGLPLAFWLLIITLILVFHVFLFKLIYEEFCSRKHRSASGAAGRFSRNRSSSSNSHELFAHDDDDPPPNPNTIALKRLLVENASRTRRDSYSHSAV